MCLRRRKNNGAAQTWEVLIPFPSQIWSKLCSPTQRLSYWELAAQLRIYPIIIGNHPNVAKTKLPKMRVYEQKGSPSRCFCPSSATRPLHSHCFAQSFLSSVSTHCSSFPILRHQDSSSPFGGIHPVSVLDFGIWPSWSGKLAGKRQVAAQS